MSRIVVAVDGAVEDDVVHVGERVDHVEEKLWAV